MELGNMVWGHSRGACPVPREYEDEMWRVIEAVYPEWGGGYFEPYENDVFAIRSYYWGNCTCGYEELEWAWGEANEHGPDCYQTELHARLEAWEAEHPEQDRPGCFVFEAVGEGILLGWGGAIEQAETTYRQERREWSDARRGFQDALYADLMAKHNKPRLGCAAHCTCDYEARWEAWAAEHEHASDCLLIQPNFAYKPAGYELQWYKHPLRDSYANQSVDLSTFTGWIDACVKSAEMLPGVGKPRNHGVLVGGVLHAIPCGNINKREGEHE